MCEGGRAGKGEDKPDGRVPAASEGLLVCVCVVREVVMSKRERKERSEGLRLGETSGGAKAKKKTSRLACYRPKCTQIT